MENFHEFFVSIKKCVTFVLTFDFFNLYYTKDSKGKELTAKQLQIRQNLHSSFPTVDKDALDNVLESVRYMDKDLSGDNVLYI